MVTEQEIKPLLEQKNYIEILQKLVSLHQPIDNFFDRVLVMTDDIALRTNRLTLLKNIVKTFLKIADFSLIQ
ncbi:MAG: hypothetical protein QME68_01695 [Elusimicrobiota bacterium]|nr:hypothetical protein [Elusimicrobiota bacterium]